MHIRSASWITVAKVAVLVLILALEPWPPVFRRIDRFLEINHIPQAAIFALIAFACVTALLLIPFLKSTILRILFVVLFVCGGFAINQLLIWLSGNIMESDQAALLWRERGMFREAVAGYFWYGLLAVGWIVPAAVILAWKPTPPHFVHSAWSVLPAAAAFGCFAVTKLTAGGTTDFPSPFAVPAMMAFAITSEPYSGPRSDVVYDSVYKPQYRRVVMIVDESIRGDHLQINDPARLSTPFLVSQSGGTLVNFGPAIAAHNCSAPARFILRTGLKESDLPDVAQVAFKVPSIWQFAKQAGFETVYIDAYSNVFGTHSYMMKSEHAFIDKPVPIGGLPLYNRDQTIAAETLPRLLAADRPVFVYVNKFGTHFPYGPARPPGFGDNGTIASDDLADRHQLVESYRRAIKWSVDEFFRNLLGRIDLRDTLILYTSDHGQSLLEGGYKLSHCSARNVHPGEAIVPLFAIAGDADFTRLLRRSAQTSYGRRTHFDIFPTLLLALGYDKNWVARHYGTALSMPPNERGRRFLIGNMFGVRGKWEWTEVD